MRRDVGRQAMEVMLALDARGVTSVGKAVFERVREEFGIEFHVSMLRDARRVLLNDRRLAERVRDGELSLHLAFERVTKGERLPCPTCGGSGHVFRAPGTADGAGRRRRRRAKPARDSFKEVTDGTVAE